MTTWPMRGTNWIDADVVVTDAGSLHRFLLQTEQAQDWTGDNVEIPGWAWHSPAEFVVDHRMSADLIEAYRANDLKVVME